MASLADKISYLVDLTFSKVAGKPKNVKLPAHRARLPGNVISFYMVPLYPAYKAGLGGHVPANNDRILRV